MSNDETVAYVSFGYSLQVLNISDVQNISKISSYACDDPGRYFEIFVEFDRILLGVLFIPRWKTLVRFIVGRRNESI